MRVMLITIISLALCACDQVHEYTKSYPIDKSFHYETYTFSSDKSTHSLGLKIKLSYKADKRGYYNIEITGDIDELLKNSLLYIRFLDKNNMILYEMSPGWTTNDSVTNINGGIMRRGKFGIEEGIFRGIKNYEVYLKARLT